MNPTPLGAALVEALRAHALVTEVTEDLPIEERRQPRFEPVSDPLEITIRTARQGSFAALLADISAGGARFVADHVPAEDDVIQLIFTVAGRRYLLNGRVCHSGAPEGELLCFFGVEFTSEPVRSARLAALAGPAHGGDSFGSR